MYIYIYKISPWYPMIIPKSGWYWSPHLGLAIRCSEEFEAHGGPSQVRSPGSDFSLIWPRKPGKMVGKSMKIPCPADQRETWLSKLISLSFDEGKSHGEIAVVSSSQILAFLTKRNTTEATLMKENAMGTTLAMAITEDHTSTRIWKSIPNIS